MTNKFNEKDFVFKVAEQLKETGLPVVKMSEGRADLVGYTIDGEHKLIPEVVVEVKSNFNREAVKQLMTLAEQFKAPYALLVTPEKTIWFETESFLPTEEPTFKSSNCFINDLQQIIKVFYSIADQLRGDLPSQKYSWYLLQGLVARTYLQEKNELHHWFELTQDTFFDLLETVYEYYNLNHYVEKPRLTEEKFRYFIWKLGETSPTNSNYGEIFLSLIERDNATSGHLTTTAVKELFTDIINTVIADHTTVLEMGAGYGSIVTELATFDQIDKITAVEINAYAVSYLKLINIISGQQKVKTLHEDILTTDKLENDYDVVVVDSPLGKIQSHGYKEEYDRYSVSLNGKRKMLDYSELFLERATEVTKPGGYIIALVSEALLFSEATKKCRELLKERTIIEGIFSLPSHTLKPYTAVKVSVLVLRKKTEAEETAEELFLAECESVEQFTEVVDGFKTWKNGGSIE